MVKVLRLDSSIFGRGGASTRLNDELIAHLKSQHDQVQVVQRDLTNPPLPHFSEDFIHALRKEQANQSPEEKAQVALANQLIAELREADILVVGAPMYNFTVPSTLKTWMDYVARAGDTFKYTDSGAVGLLHNTQVYINTSRGGIHKDQTSDGIVPLLKSFFSLLGLVDVKVIYAEGLNMGAETHDQAMARARQTISTVAA